MLLSAGGYLSFGDIFSSYRSAIASSQLNKTNNNKKTFKMIAIPTKIEFYNLKNIEEKDEDQKDLFRNHVV